MTLLTTSGAAADSPSVVRASGADPYATCTAGAEASGTVSLSAEVEPNVAVNPANLSNLIAVWQQDRWSDGGAHGLVAGVSADGGKHFREVALPFSTCTQGGVHYPRASDPWVSIGPDGTAYAVSISFDELASGASPHSAVVAAVSKNGGTTWSDPRLVKKDFDPTGVIFNDKESVTADPRTPGTAYVVWDRSGTDGSQPAWFAKTTDFGESWSKPRPITPASPSEGTIGSILLVNRHTGVLYDFYLRFFNSNQADQEAVVSSSDGGATWSAPLQISATQVVNDVDPHVGGQPVRAGSDLPQVAIDPYTGEMYVVWEDARFTGGAVNGVVISHSTNGTNWSAPRLVSTNTGQDALTPSVAVDDSGRVGVTYYDFREFAPANPTLPTDYWFTSSPRGGNDFEASTRVIPRPFDMLATPFSGGWFVGDYEGLASSGDGFVSCFVSAVDGSRHTTPLTDVFVASLEPGSGGRASTTPAAATAPLRAASSTTRQLRAAH
ncbi:MAG TPA: sialidase family protein [Candidatus Dormibacteraeota bacterium]